MTFAVDAITVGDRHRHDLGDLDDLAASLREVGLLEPISITPTGVLVTGRRRLEALKRLGERTTPVWITQGISTRLQELLAEQHENLHRKELTPTEQAGLWAELKELYAQAATHGRPSHHSGDGTGNPCDSHDFPPGGDRRSRVRAARVITGRDSSQRLGRVEEILRLAADESVPPQVRDQLRDQLAAMDASGKVNGPYQRARALLEPRADQGSAPAPDEADEQDAGVRRGWREVDATLRARLALRRLAQLGTELDGWWEQVDADQLREVVDLAQTRELTRFLRQSLDLLAAVSPEADRPLATVRAC